MSEETTRKEKEQFVPELLSDSMVVQLMKFGVEVPEEPDTADTNHPDVQKYFRFKARVKKAAEIIFRTGLVSLCGTQKPVTRWAWKDGEPTDVEKGREIPISGSHFLLVSADGIAITTKDLDYIDQLAKERDAEKKRKAERQATLAAAKAAAEAGSTPEATSTMPAPTEGKRKPK